MLVALGGLTLIGFVGFYLLVARQYAKIQQQNAQLKSELQEVQNDLNAVINTAIGVGRHLSELEQSIQQTEKDLKQTAERQEELAHRDPDERTYTQAAKMFKRGESIDEVMDTTQLSRAEVELMRILYHRHSAGD